MIYNPLARWLIIYGTFLILAGVAGFLSNPEKAKTALISGGTFGTLSICWGILSAKGVAWSRKAAFGTLLFLGAVFSWRAASTWAYVLDGRPEKIFAACLITAMLAATAVVLAAMLQRKI